MNHDIDRDKLVLDNLALVGYVLKRILHYPAVAALGWDDAYSAGNVALVNSAKHFDQTMGFKFTTYACRAIKTEIFRTANREMKHLLPQSIGFDVAEHEDRCDLDEELIPKLLMSTSARRRRVIKMRFGLTAKREPENLGAIGEKLGISSERVRQMVNKGIAEMRESL